MEQIQSYLYTFQEGILAFISPCILPMFPVYLFYLAGEGAPDASKLAAAAPEEVRKKFLANRKLIINTLGFILGFTVVFAALGATATVIGSLLSRNKLMVQRVSGVIIILFGLYYMGVLKLPFLDRERRFQAKSTGLGFFSSALFGAAFSFGWTPCLGPFLGTAFLLAANKKTVWEGIAMLLAFSAGLGVPFFVSALLFHKLTGVFNFIKKNFRIISVLSGLIMVVAGLALVFDVFIYWASLFS